MERWAEEVRIIDAEFKRTARTFLFLGNAWTQAATDSAAEKPGFAAYAYERAQMYASMARSCAEKYDKLQLEYSSKAAEVIEEECLVDE
jgi:hypothetical protein